MTIYFPSNMYVCCAPFTRFLDNQINKTFMFIRRALRNVSHSRVNYSNQIKRFHHCLKLYYVSCSRWIIEETYIYANIFHKSQYNAIELDGDLERSVSVYITENVTALNIHLPCCMEVWHENYSLVLLSKMVTILHAMEKKIIVTEKTKSWAN